MSANIDVFDEENFVIFLSASDSTSQSIPSLMGSCPDGSKM